MRAQLESAHLELEPGVPAHCSPVKTLSILGRDQNQGLRDVTGVFSRFFVVGFFVPSLFVVLTIAWLFAEIDEARDIYVAGAGALLVALVLVGLRDAVWQALERHPWRSPFGDATFEYHERVRKEWGLTAYWAWPFIKPFFNEHERELDIDGRSDVHFFLNACLGGVAIGVSLVIDALSNKPIGGHSIFSVLLVPVAFGAAYASYAGATSAVRPWGEFKEAAVALHRHELYKGIGVERLPNVTILSPEVELELATEVNDRLAPVKGINEQASIVVRQKIEIAAAPRDMGRSDDVRALAALGPEPQVGDRAGNCCREIGVPLEGGHGDYPIDYRRRRAAPADRLDGKQAWD